MLVDRKKVPFSYKTGVDNANKYNKKINKNSQCTMKFKYVVSYAMT